MPKAKKQRSKGMKQKYYLALAVAVCAATGFLAGRISERDEAKEFSDIGDRELPRSVTRPGREASHLNSDPSRFRPTVLVPTEKKQPDRNTSVSLSMPETVKSILRNPNALERSKSWLEFVDRLDPSEFPEVAELCREQRKQDPRMNELPILLAGWADHDPYAALDYLDQYASYSGDHARVISAWAVEDPDAAIRWVEQKKDRFIGDMFISAIVKGAAANHSESVHQWINKMPESAKRDRALELLKKLMTQGDPEKVQR